MRVPNFMEVGQAAGRLDGYLVCRTGAVKVGQGFSTQDRIWRAGQRSGRQGKYATGRSGCGRQDGIRQATRVWKAGQGFSRQDRDLASRTEI